MKTKILTLAGLLILTSLGVLAQQEPQYVNQFFFLDSSSGKLMPLERQNAAMKSKAKGLGYGGASTFYQIKGPKSKVRFKSGQNLEFIVRGYSPHVDPTIRRRCTNLLALRSKRRSDA
jgi:hypothetical protein